MGSCLTRKFNGRAHVLDSECKLATAFDSANPPDPVPQFADFMAIWDTGATGSVITSNAAQKLGLIVTGYTQVHGVHGIKQANTYLVNIGLPPDVLFCGLVVTEGELSGGYDVLIGMDVIGAGDFAVTNFGGMTTMSFRCPSSGSIDFVADVHTARRQALIKSRPNATRKKKNKKR